ncbi:hypothetical protein [Streptomyces sp. CC219B]|uniref:hypothetical protein n=1 Tax=Streptomyces sp. CC219B TaxID=3044574 RepID=UPI0024A8A7A0|nr:hypothetical protein [Streptomyces sp. CC219B]
MERHRADVDRLLDLIRETGRFSSESMAIGEQLGWLRDHQVTAPSLLLWSGNVQEISPRIEELEEPRVVRRMCRMGADLQLTYFLQALVTAGVAQGQMTGADAERVVEALDICGRLSGQGDRSTAPLMFRVWRTSFLPGILRPDSTAPESGRAGFRALAHRLEDLLEG